MFCGNPCPHPTHGRRIAGPRRSWSGYIVDRRRTPAEPWTVDGGSGCLQDGEGWTPRYIHQSILVQCKIDYRPLASEVLTSLATERACLDPFGGMALGWLARLASFCRATAASADSVRSATGNVSRPTNDRRARRQRSRPSRSVCRYEAASKLCGR
jgi:hypothetical protein